MIWTEALTRRFGDKDAVSDLSLDVRRGEVYGFLGPNGAGKSTTTRMLTTLLSPTSGKAQVAGHDPFTEPLAVRKRIGYLPDELPVYRHLTATEFLVLFGKLHGLSGPDAKKRARELLERVGLPDVRGKPVGKFSKGMKQRLGLARALLNDPEVLFLDEPASGLDPMGRKEIRTLMKEVARGGSTLFLCSHDLAEVTEVCRRAAIIREGRVVREVTMGDEVQRTIHVEVENEGAELKAALTGLPNFLRATRRGPHIRIEFSRPTDRRDVARTVQRAGATLLDIRVENLGLQEIYEQAMSGEAALGDEAGSPAGIKAPEPVPRGGAARSAAAPAAKPTRTKAPARAATPAPRRRRSP